MSQKALKCRMGLASVCFVLIFFSFWLLLLLLLLLFKEKHGIKLSMWLKEEWEAIVSRRHLRKVGGRKGGLANTDAATLEWMPMSLRWP